jgi:hypothetical protein
LNLAPPHFVKATDTRLAHRGFHRQSARLLVDFSAETALVAQKRITGAHQPHYL